MKNFYYSVIGAGYAGIYEHPQTWMEALGFHLVKSEPVSVADCWWFRCDEYPEINFDYIKELPDDFKFSDER